MAKISAFVESSPPSTLRHDSDGNPVHNKILLRLPNNEWETLCPQLEFLRLPLQQLLHEAGASIRSAYFCNSGMFSVLTVMPDGRSVEVGLIGIEGFSGSPLIAGFTTNFTRTVVQGDSSGYRVEADVLRKAIRQMPALAKELQRYSQILGVQAIQIATCNRIHHVDQRLARWLLMSQDRIALPVLPLTQDFLAQMLGTRRSSVTVAAGMLQESGYISYKRGHVTILNRTGLEKFVCSCYAVLQRQTAIWQRQDS